MPLVSVVIPTLGRANLLVRSVKSALAQTMTDLEVIVLIDRPDPDATTVLTAIEDKRLRVIVHENSSTRSCGAKRGGRGGARGMDRVPR